MKNSIEYGDDLVLNIICLNYFKLKKSTFVNRIVISSIMQVSTPLKSDFTKETKIRVMVLEA